MSGVPDTIGPYTIDREIGRGGMGVVYLAHDARLGRHVAIKSLPEALTQDADRLARFDREARTLASLNHPNIAGVHAVEHADGATYLILEYVEGPTLADLLENGPLPVDDALEFAIQIAAGVEAAHDAGIIHRDLKPANIKITPDHKAKVLDFGLAKSTDASPGSSIASSFATLPTTPNSPHSPTIPGAILGTAPYMSPEQARGKPLDKRTDVWSFGVILYEMLTGAGPFQGETITDSIGAILHKDVNLDLLPPQTPRQVRRLLERCLQRDKSKRIRDIGDARLELEEALRHPAPHERAPALAPRRRAVPAAILLLACAASLVAGALLARSPLLMPAPRPAPLIRTTITPPGGVTFQLSGISPGPAVIAPDASAIVFAGLHSDGTTRLYLRRLDDDNAYPIPGTEGAQYPFWSPDSRHIGFGARGELRRAPAGGGPVVTIAAADDVKGACWGPDGHILFTPSSIESIWIVSESGGDARKLTDVQADEHSGSHRHPRFLPDARHFIYLARPIGVSEHGAEVRLSSIDNPLEHTVLTHSIGTVEIAADRLLFMSGSTLMAQPFDTDAGVLSGNPIPVCDRVTNIPGALVGVYSVSRDGALVYQAGDAILPPSDIVWYDRDATRLGTLGNPAPCMGVAISHDARSVALAIVDEQLGSADIWHYDIESDRRTRLTFANDHEAFPVFSPDDQTVYYARVNNGVFDVFATPTSGFEADRLILSNGIDAFPSQVTPDGTHIAVSRWTAPLPQQGVFLVPVAGEGEPRRIVAAPRTQGDAQFTRDGSLVAYVSDESGEAEIYVAPYPALSRKWPVSRNGGGWPRWSADGTELFFVAPGGSIMVVEVERGESAVNFSEPRVVLERQTPATLFRDYDITPDAQRLLVCDSTAHSIDVPLTLVLNWTRLLER